MREAFEKWAWEYAMQHGYKYKIVVLTREDEGYEVSWVGAAWCAWRHCHDNH